MNNKAVCTNGVAECLPQIRRHRLDGSNRAGNAQLDHVTLRTVAPTIFIAKLAVLALLSAGFTRFALQILLGATFAHATELVHQCLHRTATGRAVWDHSFGMLLATPLGISFWRYLADHFRHHK